MSVTAGPATEDQQAAFFRSLRDGFEQASARTQLITHHLRLAGTTIRLRFAGPALLPTILPALSHALTGPVDTPGLDICLWDSAGTGVPLPPTPRRHGDFTGRGNIWGFDSARFKSAYQWGEGSVSVMDRDTNLAFYWVPATTHLPPWSMAAPIRGILHWWMEKNGLQLVHAAVVGHQNRGALIPGRGGSGKSSTAIACLADGMQFVGDDYVAIALDPEPRAHCLYATAKLHPHSLDAFPGLAGECRTETGPGFDKIILFPEGRYREQFTPSLPLTCILKPAVTGRPETALGPVRVIEIERALAAETLAHLPHAGPHTLAFLERAAASLPRAELLLGTYRPGVAAAVREALLSSPAPDGVPFQPDFSPVVTVILRLHTADLAAFTAELEAQNYPRLEIAILANSEATAETANIPFNVYFLPFENTASKADAWNRGIRDTFGELLFFMEVDDRIPPGAIQTLVTAAANHPDAAIIRGSTHPARPLAGALVRKEAFRTHGLFDTGLFLIGREEQDWMERVRRDGLKEHTLHSETLHPGATAGASPGLRAMKERLDRLREFRGGK